MHNIADSRDRLRGEQRMAAHFEEVIVDADLGKVKYLGKYIRQPALVFSARRRPPQSPLLSRG